MIKSTLRIFAVPLFADNYSYIVQSSRLPKALTLVDPANPTVISHCLKSYFSQYTVKNILYTHKHWDHAGGAVQLLQLLHHGDYSEKIEVFAGKDDAEHIATVTQAFEEDSEISLVNRRLKIYQVPCHTRGHTIYHFLPDGEDAQALEEFSKQKMQTSQGQDILTFQSDECAFTGDTLFCGGVGKFFEGNAEEMLQNLKKIHANLGSQCHIYNGHEYTLGNLQWGTQAEPDNQKIIKYLQDLESGSPKRSTLPTTPAKESEINVFYRAATLDKNQLGIEPVEYLRALRAAKDDKSSDLKKYAKL